MEIVSEWGPVMLDGRYPLKFGASFKDSPHYFHTIRYDFKPASVEQLAQSYVEFSENNEVTVTIPKVNERGDVKDATLYKGSKRVHQKEFLLLFNHDTQSFTLEKLTYNVQVKKTRGEVGSETLETIRQTWKGLKSLQPSEENLLNDYEASPSGEADTSPSVSNLSSPMAVNDEEGDDIAETLEAALSSNPTETCEGDMPDIFATQTLEAFQRTAAVQPPAFDQLHQDLQLSESSGEE